MKRGFAGARLTLAARVQFANAVVKLYMMLNTSFGFSLKSSLMNLITLSPASGAFFLCHCYKERNKEKSRIFKTRLPPQTNGKFGSAENLLKSVAWPIYGARLETGTSVGLINNATEAPVFNRVLVSIGNRHLQWAL